MNPSFRSHLKLALLIVLPACLFAAPPEPAVQPTPLVVGIGDSCNPARTGHPRNFFVDALAEAGHIPVVIGRCKDPRRLEKIIARLDVLVLPGGADVDPSRYGETNVNCAAILVDRDEYEYMLLDAAVKRRLPILGICRGEQILNVYFGGSLYQDIDKERPDRPNPIAHRQGKGTEDDVNPLAHSISLAPGSRLASVLGPGRLFVNSRHHQAVKRVAPGFKVTARADDGVVEAIESSTYPAVGLQFHPETLIGCKSQDPRCDLPRLLRIFRELDRLCRNDK